MMRNDDNKKPILEMIGNSLDFERGNFHCLDLVERFSNGFIKFSLVLMNITHSTVSSTELDHYFKNELDVSDHLWDLI